jgi:hypothetical protein
VVETFLLFGDEFVQRLATGGQVSEPLAVSSSEIEATPLETTQAAIGIGCVTLSQSVEDKQPRFNQS